MLGRFLSVALVTGLILPAGLVVEPAEAAVVTICGVEETDLLLAIANLDLDYIVVADGDMADDIDLGALSFVKCSWDEYRSIFPADEHDTGWICAEAAIAAERMRWQVERDDTDFSWASPDPTRAEGAYSPIGGGCFEATGTEEVGETCLSYDPDNACDPEDNSRDCLVLECALADAMGCSDVDVDCVEPPCSAPGECPAEFECLVTAAWTGGDPTPCLDEACPSNEPVCQEIDCLQTQGLNCLPPPPGCDEVDCPSEVECLVAAANNGELRSDCLDTICDSPMPEAYCQYVICLRDNNPRACSGPEVCHEVEDPCAEWEEYISCILEGGSCPDPITGCHPEEECEIEDPTCMVQPCDNFSTLSDVPYGSSSLDINRFIDIWTIVAGDRRWSGDSCYVRPLYFAHDQIQAVFNRDEFTLDVQIGCLHGVSKQFLAGSEVGNRELHEWCKASYEAINSASSGTNGPTDQAHEIGLCWVDWAEHAGGADDRYAYLAHYGGFYDFRDGHLTLHELLHIMGAHHYPTEDKRYDPGRWHAHWWGWHFHWHKSIMNYVWMAGGGHRIDSHTEEDVRCALKLSHPDDC